LVSELALWRSSGIDDTVDLVADDQ